MGWSRTFRAAMADGADQLTLSFPVAEKMGDEDFLVSDSNEEAYAAIERWPDWPDKVLLLIGPTGSGKSHLASIWSRRAHAWLLPPGHVTEEAVPQLVSGGALTIDGIEQAAINEAALFHLLNAARSRGCYLLITASHPPDQWGLRTPDLVSRLRLAPIARIGEPDDALLRSVLVKLFLDRQLVVDTAVIETIVARGERSFDAARAIVEEIDRRALASGRRISRVLVQDLLNTGEDAP